MNKASTSSTTRISSFVLIVILITLLLSLTALYLAITALFTGETTVSGYLLLAGFIGLGLSTYMLFQTRRRIQRLRIEVPPVTTTIECGKCGFKSIREFQRGDHIFKEVEPCQKCKENMMITAIYREVKERKTKKLPF